MTMTIPFSLEPLDPENPSAGYRAVVEHCGLMEQEALAEEMIREGLPTDVETILGLFGAQQAAVASLTWEGWDVAAPGVIIESPWPDAQMAALLGGTVSGRATAGRDQLARRMIEHGTPHTRSRIEVYFDALFQVLLRLLRAGYAIELPTVVVRPVIEGRFTDPDDEFDFERHEITCEFDEKPVLTDWLEGYRELKRRGQAGAPRLLLDGYADVESDRTDGLLRVGGQVRLHGYWLRFQPSDPRQGVFFLADDGAPVRVEQVTAVGVCEVTFLVPPDLPPGPYWLELRAVVLPCHGLQRALFPRQLTVLAAEAGHS